MKTLKKVLALVIVAVLCFSLASCSMVDDTDITKDNIKIGVILPGQREDADDYVPDLSSLLCVSAINDLISFGAGINNDRFQYIEKVDPTDENAAYNAIHTLTNRECTLIFLADPGYMGAVEKYVSGSSSNGDVSVQDSKVQYIVYNGKEIGNNVHSYTANISGAVYLSGVAAALKAKELKVPKIGYLLKSESDLALLNAFALGAQSAYSDVKIEAKVCKDVKSDCHTLVANGNVVLASDFYSEEIAENREDAFFCGFGSDRLADKDGFICVPRYDFAQYYLNTIMEDIDYDDVEYDKDGKEIDKSNAVPEIPAYNGSYKDGATYLSKLGTAAAPGTQATVDSAEALILNGKLSQKVSATVPVAGVTIVK